MVPTRIYIVDDESALRRLLTEILNDRGYHIESFETAEDALKRFTDEPCDILLVDVALPGMNGFELCRHIRTNTGNPFDPSIIVLTAWNSPNVLTSALDAGSSDFLTKPVRASYLQTRVEIAARHLREARKRKEAERALIVSESATRSALTRLQERQNDFNMVIEKIPNGVIVFRDDRIVYANASFSAALGYEATEDLVDTLVFDHVAPDDLERCQEWLSRSHETTSRSIMACGFVRSDGERAHFEVSSPQKLRFDDADSSLIVVQDVTERRNLQSQLLLADRLVSVGTLAAGITHEINNPLSYIIANLHYLSDEITQLGESLETSHAEDLQDLIGSARRGAERVATIVNDVRTFSRADEDDHTLVDVRRVLDLSTSMASNAIRHKARVAKNYEEVPYVEAGEAQLGQVFLNLLINAAQAIPDGPRWGEIRLYTYTSPEGAAVVEVRDSGEGMPDSVKSRIFDPFYTTKPVGIGTGLGLSICHGIITSLGGGIEVESELGVGTVFRVTLPGTARGAGPIKVSAKRPPSPRPSAALGVRPLNILIVDDEPEIARVIERVLRLQNVTIANTGRTALDLLLNDAQRFDLVFCDLLMPDLSGIDIYAQVKDRDEDLARRFVFITGGANTQRARDFLKQIPNVVITKPFDTDVIHSIVKRVLNDQSRSSE